MTDRLKGVTVAFDRDIREDDAEAIINAIRQLRCVVAVEPVKTNHAEWIEGRRVKMEMRDKILKVLSED